MYKRMQRKQEYNKKRISPSVVAIIGSILTLTGGFFISYNYIQSKKVVAYDYMANIFYESNKENKEVAAQISETTETREEKPVEE